MKMVGKWAAARYASAHEKDPHLPIPPFGGPTVLSQAFWGAGLCLAVCLLAAPATSQSLAATGTGPSQPVAEAYDGVIRAPDFAGRDRKYSRFRTRIREQIAAGPNFARHLAIIEIGCGTGCRHVFVADIATGRVFDFPLSGSAFDSLDLTYQVTSNVVRASWRTGYRCVGSELTWTGATFTPARRPVAGVPRRCD